jgi:2-methylcitrate dehydratase
MVYIISTIVNKALNTKDLYSKCGSMDETWKTLMMSPFDYGVDALNDKNTRKLMERISFEHGGKAYDDKYPEGIPTSLKVTLKNG